MWDDILELILELILDGSIEAADNKRVPMPVRIILAMFLIAVFFGVCVLLIIIGIEEENTALKVLGMFMAAAIAALIGIKIRRHKK